MNHAAEIKALKARLADLEAAASPEAASSPVTAAERYGNALAMARNASELPSALAWDQCGQLRFGNGSLASTEQIERAFALKPQLKQRPQPVAEPADDPEVSPTEKRTRAKIAANEKADEAYRSWSVAGLPKGWYRDTCGIVRTGSGNVAPKREEPSK